MICENLRDALVDLEQRGNVIRVSKTVDVSWEVACLVKWMFQAVEEPNRCGMWFENVAGYNIPVVVGALRSLGGGLCAYTRYSPRPNKFNMGKSIDPSYRAGYGHIRGISRNSFAQRRDDARSFAYSNLDSRKRRRAIHHHTCSNGQRAHSPPKHGLLSNSGTRCHESRG